jgi:hypothetical protein
MRDPDKTERALAALLAALGEAKDLAARGRIDADFRDLLRFARELQEIIVDGLGPEDSELRSVAVEMAVRAAELDALARSGDQGLH